MADWVTISSLATAGGTLVLALATFSSVRSANRSARVAERSLLAGLRPILIPTHDERMYMAIGLRNGGNGLAVIHGWRVEVAELTGTQPPSTDEFRDYEGGQRTIARIGLTSDRARDGQADDEGGSEGDYRAEIGRYWNVDGDDPRIRPTPDPIATQTPRDVPVSQPPYNP
jgi:hypothetical protein